MKFATMLQDVLQSLVRKPATQAYPFEREDAPTRLRGKLEWDPEQCTGCCLCQKECPSDALELITLDRKEKRFVMRYHVDRCTYCAQCVQNCRFDCLGMSSEDWELAATNKEAFTIYYGNDAEMEEFMATIAAENGAGE